MKKSNNQTLEVLEPEVEEIPLEQVIDNTLVKHNVTDAVISSLKTKYGGMQLKSLDDKESYLDIKEGRKEVRKVGILTEKLCKHGREDAIKIQKMWLAKEKQILAQIAEVEDPLNAEIERFDNEVERKELAEKKRQEEIYINRQTALSRMGATYDNGSYVLNHISYEVDLIKAADNEQWNDTIYPKYKNVYEENQAAIVEEENKRKSEIELAKKQREEFELQQVEFKKQQEVFAKQQQELKNQMADAEREKNEKNQRKLQNRLSQMEDIKWNSRFAYRGDEYDPVVTLEALLDYDDEAFEILKNSHNKIVAERKKQVEEKRLAQIEEEKQAAIRKALEEQKIKQQQEEQRKADELAKAGDKAKFQHFIGQVQALQIPPMSSGLYRNKIQMAKEKIEEIINL